MLDPYLYSDSNESGSTTLLNISVYGTVSVLSVTRNRLLDLFVYYLSVSFFLFVGGGGWVPDPFPSLCYIVFFFVNNFISNLICWRFQKDQISDP